MDCILKKTLEREFRNRRGIAEIVPHWDEEALRECPGCGGLRYLQSNNAQGYRVVSPCPGEIALRRIDAYNQALVPSRFMQATFDSYRLECLRESAPVRTFMQRIRNYKKGDSGFLLEGGPGTGKTHLLCAAIRYLTLELGVPCRYVDYSNLLSDIRASYGQNVSEAVHIEPLASVPVLFLDELGKGRDKKNDFEIRIIDEIINRRYLDPDLTTIFASNYRDRDTSGFNAYRAAGYGDAAREWEKYAAQRYRTEGFPSAAAFKAYVDQLMKLECIEDRVSERTASRILGMAAPIYIDASDYRRGVNG